MNPKTLSESEWRTIHKALTVYRNQFGSVFLTEYAVQMKQELQQLINKVRDNYIP